MSKNNYLKEIGARIFSEANDLKRTISAMANDLDIDVEYLQKVIKGDCKKRDTFSIIKKIEKIYPIDSSDLILINNDCKNGVSYLSVDKSKATSRVFNRLNKDKKRTPFYEYRDTAMSKLAPFKPEWIKELRVVNNSNPNNPDVAYNNGHFMHQMTFFVGPVNFYYEIDGKKFCQEMNTGDSNYITPYLPHTFTSRDKNQEAYIVAVTFGGDVRRAQKELYALGQERTLQYKLDIKNENKAVCELILQNMKNENITKDMLKDFNIDTKKLLNKEIKKTQKEISEIASILNIEPLDLAVPKYQKEHEVVVCKKTNTKSTFFPSKKSKKYEIFNLSRANKLPNLKGFNINILSNKIGKKDMFDSSLHTYIYNYKKKDLKIVWIYQNKKYSKILKEGDSIYIQPFIKYGFKNIKKDSLASVCVVRVGGSVNLCTQKELSYFSDVSRVASENKCWFN